MNIRRLLPTLFGATVLAVLPATAPAHVHLDKSEPADQAVVTTPPDNMRLWFSGRVEAAFSEVEIRDENGEAVAQGKPKTSEQDPKRLELKLPETLEPGTYQVFWNVVAADGHRIQGESSFTVKKSNR